MYIDIHIIYIYIYIRVDPLAGEETKIRFWAAGREILFLFLLLLCLVSSLLLPLALVLLLLPPSLSFPPHAQTNDVLQQLAPLVVGVELLAELLRLTQYLG